MNIKLDKIKNAVTSKAGRQILHVQKQSPNLLFGAGVVGVIGTAVLAARATLKLEEVLETTHDNLNLAKAVVKRQDIQENYTERDYQRDVAIIYTRAVGKVAKLYAPSVLVGTASIAALTGSHVILTKRNMAVTAAYAAVEKTFNEYRQRVVSELGEDKERELRYETETREIIEETKTGPQTKNVVRVSPNSPSGYARFFDEYCKSWSKQPEYNSLFLRCQQNWANDLLQSRGHVFLNEVYDMLGIERSRAGAVVGWVISKDGDNYVDFGIFDGDNPKARDFVNGREGSILLDFNVDGVIYDKI